MYYANGALLRIFHLIKSAYFVVSSLCEIPVIMIDCKLVQICFVSEELGTDCAGQLD